MKPHCSHCPVGGDLPCLGAEEPEAFGYWCPLAHAGGEIDRRMIVGRSAIGQTPPRPQETPGLLRRAASFAGAVVGHVAAGAPTVSAEVKEARLAICRSNVCGQYRDEEGVPACLACGCGRRGLAVKASWADQSCPLEPPLWGPVTK